MNELKRAIETARTLHSFGTDPPDSNAVILGALIQAVELLAGERVQEPTERPTVTFDEGLVERLSRAAKNAWEIEADPCVIGWDHISRAILTELALMPCELPTAKEVCTVWNGFESEFIPEQNANKVLHMLRTRLAPILAAKNTEIARLSQLVQNHIDGHKKFVHDAASSMQAAQTRIAKLESRTCDADRTRRRDLFDKLPPLCAERISQAINQPKGVVLDVLAELSHTIDVTAPSDFIEAWKLAPYAHENMRAIAAYNVVQKHVVPPLVAKDKALEEATTRIVELENERNILSDKLLATQGTLDAAHDRIAQLEKDLANVRAAQKSQDEVAEAAPNLWERFTALAKENNIRIEARPLFMSDMRLFSQLLDR